MITVMDMPTPITHQEMNYVPINIGDVCDFQLGLGTSTYIIKPKRNGDPGPYKTWAVGYSLFLEEGMGAGLEASGNLSNVNAVMWAFDEDFNVVAYNDGFNGGLPTHIDMVAAHTGTYNILVTGFIEFVTGAGSFSVLDYDPIRVTGVSVSPTDITVALGRYGDLTATITPENADYKACLWTISDPTIASINSRTGRLFGLKEGTAIVTATTRDGGFTATSNVTVAFVPNPEYDGLLYGFNLANPGGLPMGFVNIDPLDGESMQLLNPNFYNLYAGEYYDGLIYAYALVDYGIFQVKNFYIIDALTWELQVDIPMITQVCYDMAYDYSTDTMYGLTDNADGVRILGIVDMATGLITEIGPITMDEEENAVTLACDNSGVLYTISNAGILYKITDKTTLAAEKIGNTGYSVKYVQSMTYDHIGQSLYWGNISTDDTSHLLKIDKETGVCLSESALGVGVAEVTALFALANPDQIVETPVDPIPVEGVSITPEISTLEIGEKIKLKPIFAPTNANDKRVTWYSTSDAIATVSTKGIVTANAPGSCDIVVTTVDGEFTAKALISVNVIAPSQLPTGYCRVTLTNLDVWGNGIGYQMLLDSAHCSYGTTISSTEESLTPSGDVPQEIYDLFDHKIPKNADGALDTQNKVVNGSVSILVPEGIYDFCVVLPIQGDKMWFATNGCADDFVMTAGNEYTFTISLDSGSDMCTWTNQWIGFSDPIEMVTVTFLNFDDSIIATSIVEKGTTALAPNVPIRIGYTFIGWDKEITNVQTDMTVKAVFERLANWADVNGDGVTNTGDVSLILAYLVRKVELTPDQMIVADANGDGNVNSGDAATTMEFALVN
ncbi:MAG: Ig-like domain-containing protein [Clostridia bacterium]